jgi:hypothetical protein
MTMSPHSTGNMKPSIAGNVTTVVWRGGVGRSVPVRPGCRMRLGVGVAALAGTLVVGGCTPGVDPSPRHSAVSSPAASSPSPSASPPGPMYSVAGLDLCKVTDRTPLDDLALHIVKTDNSQPPGFDVKCLLEMRNRSDYPAWLTVMATAQASPAEAVKEFKAIRSMNSSMTFVGEVDGVGDQAIEYTRNKEYPADKQDGTPAYKLSDCLLVISVGNLVMEVFLQLGGVAFTPITGLAPRALAIAKATITRVPRV